MFNFQGITHIMTNPDGHAPGHNFSFCGSVPSTCLVEYEATPADIMAGRSHHGKAYKGHKMETIEQALEIARKGGAKLCESPTCSCRQLF